MGAAPKDRWQVVVGSRSNTSSGKASLPRKLRPAPSLKDATLRTTARSLSRVRTALPLLLCWKLFLTREV
jgi:hypothetical protein